ncbi:MAG: regulatory protein RecX [Rikenellaceae bacterium]
MRRERVTKPFRAKSAEEALASLMRQCARAEKSSGDAMRLMARWGVAEAERGEVLAQLIADKFIDDGRYAEAYVREKLNLSGWGVRKIATSLKVKGVAPSIIGEVLAEVDRESMSERLLGKVERKARTTKYKDQYDLKGKLIRYALSLGYDYDMALDAVSQIVTTEHE